MALEVHVAVRARVGRHADPAHVHDALEVPHAQVALEGLVPSRAAVLPHDLCGERDPMIQEREPL